MYYHRIIRTWSQYDFTDQLLKHRTFFICCGCARLVVFHDHGMSINLAPVTHLPQLIGNEEIFDDRQIDYILFNKQLTPMIET